PAKQTHAAEIEKLIAELGDADYTRRDDAYQKLVELGNVARSALERATKNSDPEIVARVQKILADLPALTHTLVDALGKPIPSAEIPIKTITRQREDITLHETLRDQSDEFGRFALPNLSGQHHGAIIEIHQPDYGIGRLELFSTPGNGELRFALVPA